MDDKDHEKTSEKKENHHVNAKKNVIEHVELDKIYKRNCFCHTELISVSPSLVCFISSKNKFGMTFRDHGKYIFFSSLRKVKIPTSRLFSITLCL